MVGIDGVLRLALAGCVMAASPAWGQGAAEWPKGPVKMVAGFTPGGPIDIVARAVSNRLASTLKQPVLVDNRPGATGTIAAGQVARSAPDGSTLLMGGPGLAVASSTYEKLPYDAEKDLTPISIIGESTMVLVVSPQVPAKTVGELVAAMKAAPGKYSYASFGNGSTAHVTGELFKQATGTDMLHVPYRGSSQALTDLMGGQVQVMFEALPTALPHIREGRLRALAVTANQRAKELPDVATVAEAGIPNFNVTLWWCVLGPANMPAPLAERISREVNATLSAPEVLAQFATLAIEPRGTSPQAARAYFHSELRKYGKVVSEAKIRVD